MKPILCILISVLTFSFITKGQQPTLMINKGHSREINKFCYSPDGKLIASNDYDKRLIIWDANTGRELIEIDSCDNTIGFSHDSKKIFLTQQTFDIKKKAIISNLVIWNLNLNQQEKFYPDIPEFSSFISKFCISQNEEYFAYYTGEKICLYDLKKFKLTKSYNAGYLVNDFCFSLDNRYLACAQSDNVIVWEISSGKKMTPIKEKLINTRKIIFSKDNNFIYSFGPANYRISLNGKNKFNEILQTDWNVKNISINETNEFLASINEEGLIKIYNVDKENVVHDFIFPLDDKNANDIQILLNPYGTRILTKYKNELICWNAASGKKEYELSGNINSKSTYAVNPVNNTICFTNNSFINVYNPFKNRIENTIAAPNFINQLIYTPDGKFLIGEGVFKKLRIWETNTFKEVFSQEYNFISEVFSNNKLFAVADALDNEKGNLSIYRLDNKKLVFSTTTDATVDYGHFKNNFVIANGSLLNDNGIVKFSFVKIIDINSFKEYDFKFNNSIFHADIDSAGEFLIIDILDNNYKPTVMVYNIKDNKKIKEFPDFYFWSLQDNNIILRDDKDSFYVWDILSKRPIEPIHLTNKNPDYVEKSCIEFNNHSYKISSTDGGIEIYDEKNDSLLLTHFLFKNNTDWVSITPDGRFEGTEEGIKLLFYKKNLDVIPVENLFDNFYTPNLHAAVFGNSVSEKVETQLAKLLPLPQVKIVSPGDGDKIQSQNISISVEVTDQGGGIDEIRLYHNGKLIDGTQRGFKPLPVSGAKNTVTFEIALINGENNIKATAYNKQRSEAIPDEITVFYNGIKAISNMYVLAVGINTYQNPRYNLNYAVKDAEGFVNTLKSGASDIFNMVNVTILTDTLANKSGIQSAIEKIKATAKPEDVFVFYYAGHGVMSSGTQDEKPEFYLVPYDVTKMYEADDILINKGISAKEIREFSKQIMAQKQLFILDACQSGGAMQTLAMRGSSEEKAIAQLARSTGTYFIAASGTEQFASEFQELGHGVFTYSVIQALKGACISGDGKVTVNLLKSCVESRVPELSQKYKGQTQYPTGYGFGQDFPIVIVK